MSLCSFEFNTERVKSFWKLLIAQQPLLFKTVLILSSSILILYLFPKGGQFKYEFQKGRAWQYPTLYTPFDFSILKTPEVFQADQEKALQEVVPYFRSDPAIKDSVYSQYDRLFPKYFLERVDETDSLYRFGLTLLDDIYKYGVFPPNQVVEEEAPLFLIQGQTEIPLVFDKIFRPERLFSWLRETLMTANKNEFSEQFNDLFFELITPNVTLDERFTHEAQAAALAQVSRSYNMIREGALIIAKGMLVEEDAYNQLISLRSEYLQETAGEHKSFWIGLGYAILIFLTFFLLLLFLHKYRSSIYANNRKLGFVFFNILLIISLATLVIQYNEAYILAVPLCILPLVIKTFFDPRLGLFSHVLTVLLIGFIVPNSFEFVFLQIIAGIVTIQSTTRLQRRANLFITVAQILGVYLLAYIAFTFIHQGALEELKLDDIGLLLLNGMLTLFVQPLIYIYEKVFGLVSDVSLLELSDTNSALLKTLSDKAPGTFHHSLQVANLAEAAANEIGANALLVRVGALYHDIGKLKNPSFFIENQSSSVSPHEDISPRQSAKIIIDHVLEGIALAKKNNIPDRIIDFIRTHHGSTMVYYFYKKALDSGAENVIENDYRYPGPMPFSKETAILMMADAVEAASKSLKEPTLKVLQQFVDKIIDDKLASQQFNRSDITLAEIETVKKVLFKKLINVYQLRIEYPE